MRKCLPFLSVALSVSAFLSFAYAQSQAPAKTQAIAEPANAIIPTAKSDTDAEKKAAEWTVSLALNDTAKEIRVKEVIVTHLTAVRDGRSCSANRPLSDNGQQWRNSYNNSRRERFLRFLKPILNSSVAGVADPELRPQRGRLQ